MLYVDAGGGGGDSEGVSEVDGEADGESGVSLRGDYRLWADYVAIGAVAGLADTANGGASGVADSAGVLFG